MMARTIRIAVAQSLTGKTSVCGPDDAAWLDYADAMEAAYCWMIEAGETPADRFWVTVEVPEPSAMAIDLSGELIAADDAP